MQLFSIISDTKHRIVSVVLISVLLQSYCKPSGSRQTQRGFASQGHAFGRESSRVLQLFVQECVRVGIHSSQSRCCCCFALSVRISVDFDFVKKLCSYLVSLFLLYKNRGTIKMNGIWFLNYFLTRFGKCFQQFSKKLVFLKNIFRCPKKWYKWKDCLLPCVPVCTLCLFLPFLFFCSLRKKNFFFFWGGGGGGGRFDPY